MFKSSGISKRAAVTFVTLLILCGLAVYFLVERKYQIEYIKMERVILNQSNKLTAVLTKLFYKTQALSALVIQHNGKVENFEKVASTLVDDPAILNVLVAPGGVVSDVYPRKGNEAVLGLKFFRQGRGQSGGCGGQGCGASDSGRSLPPGAGGAGPGGTPACVHG